jgi:predicted O-methyltransferase YrrM
MMFPRLLLNALLVCVLAVPQPPDDNAIWRDFISWLNAQPDVTRISQDGYRAKLLAEGLPSSQVDERMAVIGRLVPQKQAELSPIYFNKLYVTPDQTRFTLEPNAFLVAMTKDLKPGKALDVAMGQGRNAVYLASKGWDVTGYDVAEDGLRVARENAARAGTKITTVKARFEDFDYGQERWDLIYFVYTDAPVVDPSFVARICAALKKGGLLLIDRPFHPLDRPEPEWGPPGEQDKINALPRAWSDLQLVHYEDTTGIGDWQQTRDDRVTKPLRIVRVLARKW